MNEKLAELEAVLFIHGEPITLKKLGSVLGVEQEELAGLMKSLAASLEEPSRGLTLSMEGSVEQVFGDKDWHKRKVQLVTKPAFGNIVESFVKEDLKEDLTPASVEALSLIAYFGPITRAELEYLRGVNSSFILRNLSVRGLIERDAETGEGGVPRYRLSFDCMHHLGIGNPRELPDYDAFREVLEKARSQGEEEKAPEGAAPAHASS